MPRQAMPEIHHVERQSPGAATAECNADIITVIIYTCVLPAMTSQKKKKAALWRPIKFVS